MPKLITKEFLHETVYSRTEVAGLFKEFYEKVKHGDEEHQKWLLEETLKFISDKILKDDNRKYSN